MSLNVFVLQSDRAPLRAHTEAASRAVATVFDKSDVGDETARIAAFRVHGQLHVDVTTPLPLDHQVQNVAAVHIIAALRALDPNARGIDVSFGH
jgi:UDP-N-acetylmuramyl pentapeptide synthase